MTQTGTTRGFRRANQQLRSSLGKVFEKRGVVCARLLTRWAEFMGPEIARIARPVKISYGHHATRSATLVLLCTGANAPIVDMQKEQIISRANAAFGYRAITDVRITQTAPHGFTDDRRGRATRPSRPPLTPEAMAKAEAMVAGMRDSALAEALKHMVTAHQGAIWGGGKV
ncbi:MAG: DUF721 domain-containing protein [Rhodobacteraceae bacterium]|nr:DUF721 domain-containing protein [Paracoccaceae bacterium]